MDTVDYMYIRDSIHVRTRKDEDFNRVLYDILDSDTKTLNYLMALNEYDKDTFEHSLRVMCYAYHISKAMGISPSRDLILGGMLHDIGKLLVSKDIINKTSSLTGYDWSIIKLHPIFGRVLISTESRDVMNIITYHHEKLDGSGYYGVRHVSLNTQIVSVCDIFDALVSKRSYKEQMSLSVALNILHSDAKNGKISMYIVNVLEAMLHDRKYRMLSS